MKPREFWITFEGDPKRDKSSLRWVSLIPDESTMGFEVIHCREVVPIDWPYLWGVYQETRGVFLGRDQQDLIEKLVEKQRAGEE